MRVRALAERGRIPIASDALGRLPRPSPRSAVAWERVEGMLLGLAVGDALGNTTEGRLPHERREEHGEIRDYLPNRYADHRAVGLPSDDSQLAFRLLEHLLEHGRVVPDALAATIADGRPIFGIGQTVKAFVRALRAGLPWHEAAPRSAGNGALMRIAPVVVPHLADPGEQLWEDAVLGTAVTHNDPTAIGASVAFVGILWDLLAMPVPPAPGWWVDRFVALAQPLEGDVALTPRSDAVPPWEGPLWRFVDERVRDAMARGLTVVEADRAWLSGAYLLETVPSALHILARHGGDPEAAIVRAVNDTKDNDTIAAIVGAAVGALHGRHALPARWIDGLLGRTTTDDDGRVFELIERARRAWG